MALQIRPQFGWLGVVDQQHVGRITLDACRGQCQPSISTTIATAVEEQGAATREIARSVQEAAAGTSEVSVNVAGASQAADQSRILADSVLVASGELNEHATELFERVDRFLAGLRNAA
jgi:methyl-accepting chemotaxis protein